MAYFGTFWQPATFCLMNFTAIKTLLICFDKYQISPWKISGKIHLNSAPNSKKLDQITPRSPKNQDHFTKGAQKSPKSSQFSHSAGSVTAAPVHAAQEGGVLPPTSFINCHILIKIEKRTRPTSILIVVSLDILTFDIPILNQNLSWTLDLDWTWKLFFACLALEEFFIHFPHILYQLSHSYKNCKEE